MKGPRFDRILAGMTVAVTLVALFSVFQWGDLTAVPTGASPAGQSAETSSAPTAPASDSPAATIDATPVKSTDPVSAIEQNVVSDPLASLDPADRAVAEKIRDLLAAKSDAIFPSKSERMAVEILLSESNSRSPLARERCRECARDGGDCPPQGRRCRWPRRKRAQSRAGRHYRVQHAPRGQRRCCRPLAKGGLNSKAELPSTPEPHAPVRSFKLYHYRLFDRANSSPSRPGTTKCTSTDVRGKLSPSNAVDAVAPIRTASESSRKPQMC